MVIPGHIADSTITGCPNTAATVPADYVGLSIEWSMVKVWLGANRASVITPFVARRYVDFKKVCSAICR